VSDSPTSSKLKRPYPHDDTNNEICPRGEEPPRSAIGAGEVICEGCGERLDAWAPNPEKLCQEMGWDDIYCIPGSHDWEKPSFEPYHVGEVDFGMYGTGIGLTAAHYGKESLTEIETTTEFYSAITPKDVAIFLDYCDEELSEILQRIVPVLCINHLRLEIRLVGRSCDSLDDTISGKSKLINYAKGLKDSKHQFKLYGSQSGLCHELDGWPY